MAKRRRERMSEAKKNIIAELIHRNGVKHKKLRSTYGEIPIDVPQDRDGDFEPRIVPKRKKDISEIEQKIIAMSAKGMTTRQISDKDA